MSMRCRRSAYLASISVITASLFAIGPARAGLDSQIEFNLPAAELAGTLVAISRQGQVLISFPPEIVAGRRAAALTGRSTVREALLRVLAGTGLRLASGPDGSVTVVRDAGAPSAAGAAAAGDVAAIDVTDEGGGSRFGDVGFQAGDAGDTVRLAGAAAKDVPITVNTVTKQVIRSQALTNATDAAQNVAGVSIAAGDPNSPNFTIRGFQSQNNVTVDGLGRNGFGQIPIDDVDRVEVLKGPTSLLTGASASGGLINISTKQPTSREIRDVTVRYGSFNYKTLAFDFGGPVAGTEGLTYRFNLSGNHADENYAGYREPHEYLISPAVRWENGDTSILAGLRYFDQKRVPNQYTFVPRNGVNLDHPAIHVPLGTTEVNPNLHYRDQTTMIYSDQSHHFGDFFGLDVTLNNRFKYQFSSDDINSYAWTGGQTAGAPPGSYRAQQSFINYDFSQIVNQSDLTLVYDAGFAKQTSKFGLDYIDNNLTQSTSKGPLYDTNPALGFPRQALYRTPTLRPADFSTVDGNSLGYYYLEKFDTLDNRLHILGQVRYDQSRNRTAAGFTGNDNPTIGNSKGLSWVAGGAFDVTPYFTVYGNRAVGFVPQYTIVASTGQGAPPETRDQWEVGGRFFLFDKKLTVTTSYFDLRAQNVAQCDPVLGCNFVVIVPGQSAKGVEFDMQGEIVPGLNVIGSFSSIVAKYQDTQFTFPLAARPQYTASLWATYTIQDGPFQGVMFGLGGRGNSNSGTQSIISNVLYNIPGYVTADALIGYDFDRWSIQFKINNIFDKYYYQPSYFSTYVDIGQGRNYLLQARYSFE